MKKVHILLIILIAVCIGAIMATVSDSSTYADFSEAASKPDEVFHVVGKLNKNKPLEFNPAKDANLFTFYMVDNKGLEKKVRFRGSKPQDFERSEQIVITGSCNQEEFEAAKILMKCPSKYNNGQTEMTASSQKKS
jgi:cytochrome c-type biogenesis protein CcmE